MDLSKFGNLVETYKRAEFYFEEFLIDEIGLTDWTTYSYDDYLCKFYIYEVDNDNRITDEGYEKLKDQAFVPVTLCHKDGTRTEYPSGLRIKYDSPNKNYIVNKKPNWHISDNIIIDENL